MKDKNQKGKFKETPIKSDINTPHTKFQTFLAICACIALPLIIYSNSLHAPFFFDDFAYIVNNPDIRQLDDLKMTWSSDIEDTLRKKVESSRPLTFLSFAMNYYFGKLSVSGYHWVNIFLHVLNTIMIFFLVRKTIFYIYKTQHIFLPLATSLLFTSHPINTEVVTYISHRSDSLATLFYLASLFCFIKACENHKLFYLLSTVCFLFSFLSKEIAVSLPILLLVFDFMLLSNFKIEKVIEKKFYHLSFWLLLFFIVAFRHFSLGQIGDLGQATFKSWSHFSYFITQSFVVLKYLKILFIPIGQCVDHFIEPAKSIFEVGVIFSLIFWLLLITLAYLLIRKNYFISRLFLVALICFLVTLAPTSSFLPIGDAMAERRLYLPGLGYFLMIICLYLLIFKIDLQENWRTTRYKMLCGFLGMHITLLSITSYKRNQLYQNPILLWEEAISNYPNNPRAHYNLGNFYYDRKEYDKALQFYQRTIQLNPTHPYVYNNLGNVYYDLGQYNQALQVYRKGVELNPNNPIAFNNLGNIYYEQRDYDKAVWAYKKTLELNPNFSEGYNNVGNIYYMRKEYNKALQAYQKAIKINPNYADAYYNLGNLYYIQKKYKDALNEFIKASNLATENQFIKNKIESLRKIIGKF